MKLNRKWIMVLALVMSMAMATTGTLAYLTDRDSEANVFTMGNVEIDLKEDFVQDSELIPGVEIEKKPTITNTGKNDAWVWATVAVPAGLEKALDIDWPTDDDANWTKLDKVEQVDKDEVTYNVYTYLYNTALAKGDATTPIITSVKMKPEVDIDPDGKLNLVVKGKAEELGWDYDDNDEPIVYVSAYAIQTKGFYTVEEGYAAYNQQWTTEDGVNNGLEWGKNDGVTDEPVNGDDPIKEYPTPDGAYGVADSAAMDAAIKAGETVLLLTGEGPYIIPDSAQGKTLTIAGNGQVIATQDDGSYEGCDYSLDGATVTFTNITINTDSTTYTGYARCNATYNNCVINGTYTLYGASEFNYCTFNVTGDVYNIWTWGAGNVSFDNCTFNCDGKSLLVYNSSCDVTLNNCVFNDSEALAPVKAAIETGVDNGNTYHNIVANNVDVNGFAINTTNCSDVNSTLWANKNGLDREHLNVVVDGVDVY